MSNGEVTSTILSNVTSWTFKTVLIVFYLALMGAVYYLWQDSVKLRDDKATIQAELAGAKMEIQYLRQQNRSFLK